MVVVLSNCLRRASRVFIHILIWRRKNTVSFTIIGKKYIYFRFLETAKKALFIFFHDFPVFYIAICM